MALSHLSHFKAPPKLLLHPLPLKTLNYNPCSHPFLNNTNKKIPGPFTNLRCSASQSQSNDSVQSDRSLYPRPQEIQWSKELANTVHLIGTVGVPVQIKQLSSGKVLAWTRLAVKKSASETSWINLTFWDELAQVAFAHVEKGQQVYVSGRLVSDTVDGDQEKPLVYYKVVVQKMNFIERSYPAVSLYDPERNSNSSGLGIIHATLLDLLRSFGRPSLLIHLTGGTTGGIRETPSLQILSTKTLVKLCGLKASSTHLGLSRN